MSSCTHCGKTGRNSDCVTCDICRKLVHTECSDLSRLEIECIRSKSRKIHYYCDKCDIVATINKLKSELDSIKTELKAVKSNEEKAVHIDTGILSSEKLIAEVEERQRRSYSLVLFNLPEARKDSDVDRASDDTDRAHDIVLPNDTNHENIKILSCTRLGKFNNEKTRPLRISFASPQQAFDVLKRYKRVRNLYLNRDLTKFQQNESFTIRSEYRARVQKGENDIILRYSNGMPRIVKSDKAKNA